MFKIVFLLLADIYDFSSECGDESVRKVQYDEGDLSKNQDGFQLCLFIP